MASISDFGLDSIFTTYCPYIENAVAVQQALRSTIPLQLTKGDMTAFAARVYLESVLQMYDQYKRDLFLQSCQARFQDIINENAKMIAEKMVMIEQIALLDAKAGEMVQQFLAQADFGDAARETLLVTLLAHYAVRQNQQHVTALYAKVLLHLTKLFTQLG